MGSPLHPILYDVVLTGVLPYLNVQDLARLMRTSCSNCEFLLRDEAWQHIKQRCVRVAPWVQQLIFDAFPWRSTEYNNTEGVRKKARLRESAKRPFKFPRGGTWYVLRTYIAKARTAGTMRRYMGFRRDHVPSWVFLFHSYFTVSRTSGIRLPGGADFQTAIQYSSSAVRRVAVALTAFVLLLQHAEVETGRIQWAFGTLEFMDAGSNKELSRIHIKLARWVMEDHRWHCTKTPNFHELFWG